MTVHPTRIAAQRILAVLQQGRILSRIDMMQMGLVATPREAEGALEILRAAGTIRRSRVSASCAAKDTRYEATGFTLREPRPKPSAASFDALLQVWHIALPKAPRRGHVRDMFAQEEKRYLAEELELGTNGENRQG
ncbi:hypothetical protein [Cupriavidus metallidurans]|uniref:Uncharacterized protein n=1 Tax=Cupriavidus metallidurans (strain ATCC 43123 / DSM 2839 / NBRC 102507 / CH34) TaxID=266264 RepID=Q1LFG2_CUPMC|nr:hypothetical protein [Cupriavidus metallidurans]ABF11114.1 hypothetical protein Rmet_4248 [Cupriavidus metallidurans CH34]QGS33067.1 hypothetical protein FOB83_30275 [Cupriavidus metallidurans]